MRINYIISFVSIGVIVLIGACINKTGKTWVIESPDGSISGKRSLRRNYYNKFSLSFRNENNALLEVIFRLYNDGVAFSSLPWQTPWRFILAGRTLAPIVENYLSHDLARPVALEDTSWINPGIASWSWWSDHPSSYFYEPLKQYVDLTAEMSWPYSLVDAGPRNLMHKSEIRRKEFDRISGLGVKRTYPNLPTMEGVRGAELYSYPGFPPTAPYLNCIYPFTRNVMGSMDYTPVTFTLRQLPEGNYILLLIADGEHKEDYNIKELPVNSETPVTLHMLPAGGFVAKITRF